MKNLIQEFNQLKSNEQVYFLKLLQESFLLQEGVKSAKEKYLDEIGEDKFNELIKVDPSKTKKYLDWICKEYLNGIDINRLKDVIEKFNNKIEKNLIQNKDINFYKSIEDLENVINETPDKSKTEQKKDIKLQDANLILDNNDFFIVQPLTWEASKLYGKGTKWCTAQEKDSSYWDTYTKKDGDILFYVRNKKYEDEGRDSDPNYKTAIQIPKYYVYVNEKINFNKIPCTFWDAEDQYIDYTLEDAHRKFGIPYEYLKKNIIIITKEEIKKWLDKTGIKNYVIRDDLTVDVNGDVNISSLGLAKIPFKFNRVEGTFDCISNYLTTLKNAPNHVGENFYCYDNTRLPYNYLKNFDFSFVKKWVSTGWDDIDRYWNEENINVNTRDGIEKWLSLYDIKNYVINADLTVDVNGYVYLDDKKLKEIPIKFNKVTEDFNCSHNYLQSLAFHPEYVGGNFNCRHTDLSQEYLITFDFSFVRGEVNTDYFDVDDKWNNENFDFNSKEGIKSWLFKHRIENYTINDDLTIDVNGNVYLTDRRLKEIPFKFNKIYGRFDCNSNKLESLKNAPNYVK